MAAPQAASLENCATISSRHALAESVHTNTAPDFWLISPFWHLLFPLRTGDLTGKLYHRGFFARFFFIHLPSIF
jgi:hypothetical protein